MKNVFLIYKRDVKNILTNWIALIVVVGLTILPSLYAWFNIKSSWDPYSNTSGIAVAIVNEDNGGSIKGTSINVGDELINKLKGNKSIGWKFVKRNEAENGVKYGTYYASIIIPSDFTKKILSITSGELVKPDLIYTVNEKRNAVAPKITEKGVTALQSQVDKAFIQMVNGTIFDLFNKFGIELESRKPEIDKLKSLVFQIDEKIPELNKAVDELYDGAVTVEKFTEKTKSDIPVMKEILNLTSDVVKKSQTFIAKTKEGISNAAPVIKEDLILVRDINNAAQAIIPEAIDVINTDAPKAKELFIKVRDKLNNSLNRVDNLIKFLQSIPHSNENKVLVDLINKLSSIEQKLNNQIDLINSVIDSIDKGQQPTVEILNRINEQAKETNEILNSILNDFDSIIVPNINAVLGEINSIADNSLKLLNDANGALPILSDLLDKTYNLSTMGKEDIKNLKTKLPAVESSIHSLAERLKELDEDASINEIIKLLKRDAKAESEYVSNPVNIKQNRLFPIPNYGSAMTPFFTTLSLWVGSLILVSIISVHVKPLNKDEKFSTLEEYFGRYLIFMSIAICQAFIVTLGDLFILKTYAANKVVFVLCALVISIVFSMIVYSLVSIFGNVGKALGVILLVLQISSSGGTFPIEVTPPFFQWLNPFLPFTYAISAMREAVGGVIKSVVVHDLIVLSGYCAASIILAVILKKRFNKLNKKFVEKFKDSGLVGEE